MKKALLFSIFYCGLLNASKIRAQGWDWGISPQFSPAVSEMGGFYPGPMTVDVSGNVFISGGTFNLYSTIFGPDTIAFARYWYIQTIVAKADPSGSFLWAIGTQGQGWASPVGLATNNSGCLYVLGRYFGDSICSIGPDTLKCANGVYSNVYYLAKINPEGNVLWAKNIAIPQGTENVTSSYISDGPNGGISIDAAGNIYTTAIYAAPSISIGTDTLLNADPTASSYDFFIAKFDSSGNPLWASRYGGTEHDYVNSIAVTPSGNVYVAGSYNSANLTIGFSTLTNAGNANNFFVIKFDTYGDPHWAKNTDGNPTASNDGGALTTDQDESIYFTGGFTMGSITFGATRLVGSVIESPFIVKYDSSGNVKWAKTATGMQSEGYGITADNCGNIWTCGLMSTNMNFSGHAIDIPSGAYDPMYIVEYDTAGNYINGMAMQNGGGGSDNILVDNMGDFFVSGDFVSATSLTSFMIGPDTLTLDSQYQNLYAARYIYGGTDGCKIDTDASVNPVFPPANTISLFPNPATDECTVHSDLFFQKNANIEIFDITGRLIQTYPLIGNNILISTAALSPGIYQCRINENGISWLSKKLVVIK